MKNNSLKKELSIDECKQISLDILKDVDKFCRENNLKYYIMGGTLLGAVRHKGYIPWDDDIDIMMPRPDYEYLIKNYKHDKYKVCDPAEGRYSYMKIYDITTIKIDHATDYTNRDYLGIDIDIFPLDGIVNNKEIIEKIYKKECFLEMLLRLSNQPLFLRNNPFKCINRIIPRIIGRKNIAKLIKKNQSTFDYDSSEYIIRMRKSPMGFTGSLKKDIYDEPVLLDFEDTKFLAPKEYEKWLSIYYGEDYMILPPIEKRRTLHDCDCYSIK